MITIAALLFLYSVIYLFSRRLESIEADRRESQREPDDRPWDYGT